MVTTWPAFTEAIHLLGRGGWTAQPLVWKLVLSGRLLDLWRGGLHSARDFDRGSFALDGWYLTRSTFCPTSFPLVPLGNAPRQFGRGR